ncbi:DNA-directed RNA polymerase subunit omega [Brachybacterium sp. EF45031]|uniref:DNA-directed RNA polymerase subunit omega n=1 Tax=Brachybacterium sillae TaxID=2810536 RepID=UPI00217D6095|nr:DNA-directed RNA polymerase subunit omega [Brachybacterium sillae]MCS6710552.1 DNA-directed RNA polymerase subunit omega [Brachybacterium sillae]
MSGTVAQPEGITNPPIDDLLEHVDSKYALVLYAAKRARQINAYYAQLSEGLPENVGPLVDVDSQEKSLSIALREIDEELLVSREVTEEELAQKAASAPAPLELGDDAPLPPDVGFGTY